MTSSRGVLLAVAYDGTAFHGWATQPGLRTVEETLRGAIFALDPKASAPRGTSRTDAGVHARRQLAAFDTAIPIPPRGWVLALNQHLPADVAVRAATVAPLGFAPRFACRNKRYVYLFRMDRIRDPLSRSSEWRVGFKLDVDKMAGEARDMEGTHDFRAFRSATDARENTVRTITSARVDMTGVTLRFAIEGNAFLHNMVRILAGTLVDVGRGRLAPGAIGRALASGERAHAGQTAPPHGLTLDEIELTWPLGFPGETWPQ